MAAPAMPINFAIQQGNAQVYLSWSQAAGATSYSVKRSTDNITFSEIATPSTFYYLDTSVTTGINYWYTIASTNSDGTSSYSTSLTIVPTLTAELCLGQLRLMSKQRADMINSTFVTDTEWNLYINQSYFELYDLLVTLYEDYYVTDPWIITTDGQTYQYDLPDGVLYDGIDPFYKLMGVDLGLASNQNAWVTLRKFEFIARNKNIYPQMTSTYLGIADLQYRLVGNTLMFIPTPSGAQFIRVWYVPRMLQLLQDTDVMDGVSGWSQYVIIRAARTALAKEESDTSTLDQELAYLVKRIEASGMNRDAGEPDVVSNIRGFGSRYGGYGGPGYDGPIGGY